MSEVLTLLRAALGDRVDTSPSALEAARADKSGQRTGARPIAVVHAQTVADVQATMRIATATLTPVVTRGAGTGLAGGAMAGSGEIALSVRGMDRLIEVSPADLLAVVEPGIINAELNAQLHQHGLWWAPDPASRAISTVGGNIATGAGGLLCAKYGVVRDAVLGVDVVLADGELVRMGHRSVKGVTGLDLTSLMIGSEGTLGVIVGATLKLRPLVQGQTHTVTAAFPEVTTAAAAAAAIIAAGVVPSVMELMDARSLRLTRRFLRLPEVAAGTALLTVQADGTDAESTAARIASLLRSAGGEVTVSTDPETGEELLRLRRSMHPALEHDGTTLIEDVSVPRSKMAAMFAEISRIEAAFAVQIPTVAHAADGNLHPNFVYHGDEVPAKVWAAADALFHAALALGGTLTGEHGVGLLKARWLAAELGDRQWRLQRGIRDVFDPNGLLNPGKVFEATTTGAMT